MLCGVELEVSVIGACDAQGFFRVCFVPSAVAPKSPWAGRLSAGRCNEGVTRVQTNV